MTEYIALGDRMGLIRHRPEWCRQHELEYESANIELELTLLAAYICIDVCVPCVVDCVEVDASRRPCRDHHYHWS